MPLLDRFSIWRCFFPFILDRCNPEQLFVQAQFTRRGGLDINPWRANYNVVPEFVRYVRQ